MSEYDIEVAMHRLRNLGVDTTTLNQDYYKIPTENLDLKKIELKHPTVAKVTSKHNIIIDSRQRDYSIYPYPNKYLVNLMEPHRSVEKIELIAAMMPKTEYNINSENNLLIVTINGVTEELYLTQGQYTIGTNIVGAGYIADGNPPVSGFIAELTQVLNTHSLSGGAFNIFLATVPPENGTGQFASVLNRLVVTNNTSIFTIDFTNTNYSSGSPYRLMGFLKTIYTSSLNTNYYGTDNVGTCSPATLQNGVVHSVSIQSLISIFDYDLIDDPKYIIMNLEFGNKSADRIESIDIASNQKFAVIIYDANEPDNQESINTNVNNVQLKFTRRNGRLKALKGSDFDKKIITFDPPITLENFKITFYKYDNSLYNFHNREHLLTFEIDVADCDPKYRY